METIESILSAIKLFEGHINYRMSAEFIFNLPNTPHKIEIYSKCIERLSQRLIKEVQKLELN